MSPEKFWDVRETRLRTELISMNAKLNKRHKVSPHPSCQVSESSGREMRTLFVIKCGPHFTPQGDKNSNPKTKLTK